jgi:outer membrane scaffolding protein for murein synthesis (MipA/OmpV family)
MAVRWRVWLRALRTVTVGLVAATALLAALIAVPDAVDAADLPQTASAPTPVAYAPPVPDWIVTIGVEGRIIPAWPGAPTSQIAPSVVPLFSVRHAGEPPPYFGPRDSFGFDVINLGQLKFGPAIKYVSDRKATDNPETVGLGNVATTIQAGAFAEYWPVDWLRLHSEVRQGFGGEGGVTGDTFLDAVVPFGQFRWSAGPRVTLASAPAINPYYGITASQSIGSVGAGLPQLPVYHAGGGLYSYGAGTQLEYFVNDQWAAHAFVEDEHLADSAANSPLVTQRGSSNQWTYGLGASYSFAMHPLW